MKDHISNRKHIGMMILTAIVTAIIGSLITKVINFPQAQAEAVSNLSTRMTAVETKQSSDETDFKNLQQQILSQDAEFKSELDTVNENVFNMARAYGIKPQ